MCPLRTYKKVASCTPQVASVNPPGSSDGNRHHYGVVVHLHSQLLLWQKHAHHPATEKTDGWLRSILAAAVVVCAMALHLSTGTLCAVDARPRGRHGVGDVAISDSAVCVRVLRHADYAVASLAIGSPPRQIPVLIRFDQIATTTGGLHVFDPTVLESNSVQCTSAGECTDVAQLARGVDMGSSTSHVVRFAYAATGSSVAANVGGLAGEFWLQEGVVYYLTATHFCYEEGTEAEADSGSGSGSDTLSLAKSDDGTLYANRRELAAHPLTRLAPAAAHKCFGDGDGDGDDLDDAVLFAPQLAALEQLWLAVNGVNYNSAPASVSRRRVVAELGTRCAAQTHHQRADALHKDLSFYEIDCGSGCHVESSVPFRRLATAALRVDFRNAAKLTLLAVDDATLRELPRLGSTEVAVVLAVVRLFMIALAAAVVYVRSQRSTSSSCWLMRVAFLRPEAAAAARAEAQAVGSSSTTQLVEDAFVGGIAIVARAGMLSYRWSVLWLDDQSRLLQTEAVAVAISVSLYFARYFPRRWLWRRPRACAHAHLPPTGRFGGSTATADAAAAVMLAFAEAPMLTLSDEKFEPIARILVALLIELIAFPRCIFSATSCGFLWAAAPAGQGRGYLAACALWLAHCCLLAVLVSDAVVTPAVFAMHRNVIGDLVPGRILAFTALVAAGMPRLLHTARKVQGAES